MQAIAYDAGGGPRAHASGAFHGRLVARYQTMSSTAFLGPIRQLGYVVEKLDHAVEAWTARLGVGPWTIIRNIVLQSEYRGAPSQPLIDIALSYRGEIQI